MDNKQGGNAEIIPIDGLYKDWFLDYASYVILERAVPAIEDGLKPVQRRIMHALKQMDDGRFHKVANVIGQTMQYHPHGDASIGDALVNMGQKELLMDTQGNWGDTRTGDSAAAPRYIETRLSPFALEVSFNKDNTEWQKSYDGRKDEPVHLPVKFPLVLSQGVEGIAVGLATKILPHNFNELLKASIAILKKKKFELYPDFLTAGKIDISNYNDGLKGGKVRVRATIEMVDKKTLHVKDIPYGQTTTSIIDSIVKANDKGKIKIKKIVDNTASEVEIEILLAPGVSPQLCIDGLYAFTNCEVSISPNACLIIDDKPHFLGVSEILKICTANTKELLRLELEIQLKKLEEKWHLSSLEKIFIENRIYRDIEECETWEAVIETIDKGLEPHKHLLMREVTRDDIVKLTEIKIKRISKYDAFKADEQIRQLNADIDETKHHLKHLTAYAIAYFEGLKNKYGKGRERRTIIANFDSIEVAQVAVANEKLYVNRKAGFVGYGLKKDEFIEECSDIDDVISIRKDGKFMVTRITDKTFVGKDILHAAVWKKGDERTVYHLVYSDPGSGRNYAKRFQVKSITRDKEYDLTKGHPKSKVLYLSVQPNGESEVLGVQLSPHCKARTKQFDFDFGELLIKGRQSQGNIVTKYPIRKVQQKSLGKSTLGGTKIWFDEDVGRLNREERGQFLGEFNTGDTVIVVLKNGAYIQTGFDLNQRFDPVEVLSIKKWDSDDIVAMVYFHGERKGTYVKRFKIETSSLNEPFQCIPSDRASRLLVAAFEPPEAQVAFTITKGKSKKKISEEALLSEIIDVKGWRVLGNKLSAYPVSGLRLIVAPAKENANKKGPEEATEDASQLKVGDQIEWDFDKE